MSVAKDHAQRIAALARLRFDEAELTRITAELNHILEHVEALRSLESRTPADAAPDERSSTRPAEADEADELRHPIASFAPEWRDGFFVVPPFPGVHADDGS